MHTTTCALVKADASLDLDTHHRQLLTVESAIQPRVINERGYRSVHQAADLDRLGFAEYQQRTPGLLLPVHDVTGRVATYLFRPDEPRFRDGKKVKYETPAGSKVILDVPPRVRPHLADPSVELFITEGVRKADAAVSQGLCCVSLAGVWTWRGTNEQRGKTALPDWESVALNDRRPVTIVFDSDIATNPHVQNAAERVKAFLELRGAQVRVLLLPPGSDGAKVGLDDFFAAGNGVVELRALPPWRPAARESVDPVPEPALYRSTDDGLVWERPTRDGTSPVQLANFTARITSELIVTDGVDEEREFEIEAVVAGGTHRVTVAADEFERMNWVLTRLGASASMAAGYGARDHVRAAIQAVSDDMRRVTVYTHLGWTFHEGQWMFVHAGGVIGADPGAGDGVSRADRPGPERASDATSVDSGPIGPIPAGKARGAEITVRPPQALSGFTLPTPPAGEQLVSAIRASLKLLDAGPDRITFPVYAALWRAPLGGATFTPFLVGTTGSGKSVLAGLAQQHFGPGMDYQNLPGAWSSTANSLEAVAFFAKDVLFVVDDWVPSGSVADVQRANRDADRLLRAQGNHSGRGRCDRDGNPKAGKPPRGLILSTGEGLPDGHSLNARLLAINVRPDELLGPANAPKVTACQKDAGAGLYAAAMAGYVRWLAEDFSGRRELFRRGVEEQRTKLQGRASHLRTTAAVAELLAAMDMFLEFAQERGAVTEDEAEALWSRLTDALDELTADQNREHTTGDPVEHFLSLLRSAVLVGEAHLADKGGGPPAEEPARWGWREDSTFVPKPSQPATEGSPGEQTQQDTNDGEWKKRHAPKGKQIGWVSGEHVFLQPEAALAVAQELARKQGGHLALTSRSLGKSLAARGKLEQTDLDRGKYTVRQTILGNRVAVLSLSVATFFPDGTGAADLEEFSPLIA